MVSIFHLLAPSIIWVMIRTQHELLSWVISTLKCSHHGRHVVHGQLECGFLHEWGAKLKTQDSPSTPTYHPTQSPLAEEP